MNNLVKNLLFYFAVLVATQPVFAAEAEFEGTPSLKITISDGVSQTQSISPNEGKEFKVVITRNGDRYFWKSRNDVPLVKTESGAYITYVAATGAGYIRALNPVMIEQREKRSQEQRAREFVYVEHLVNQLGSITYYGK